MLLTSHATATRLEAADTLHTTRQTHTVAILSPSSNSCTVPLGSGVAALTDPSFGRKLNRVTGFGMDSLISEAELVAVEKLFAERGLDTPITLCPLADPATVELLGKRGYTVDRFMGCYVRELSDRDLETGDEGGVKVTRLPAEREDEFRGVCVDGYEDGGRPIALLETVARLAILRADTTLCIASVDGEVAGSAGIALLETPQGDVAYFYVDSTLPAFRGKGVQAALLRQRLRDAREMGVGLVYAQARMGSGSARNIERAGFGLAYTKSWLVRRRVE
ncbi:hypothetical protein LSUE1_G002548 [Lachnellula suecica]|uniref:N-acetyltransferase domain-containing protein n=1 Tax=Lachnellula suecica TaxID=602035 RepID=A0A8T9C8I1_9HELO|nr:hypothetical protein LSUE1_G002548 [Lachnellula suecica]